MTNASALLVVDVQNDVMGSSINRDQVVANIVSLVGKARAAGAPVVWVRHNAEDLVTGTPGWQIVDELTPGDGEAIVDKTYSDSFADTDLSEQLRRRGVDTVVLCGAQTDACIRNTFYGGLYRGYSMTLVTDAHTTEDMRPWGAEFSPEQSISVLNMQASHTELPDARGAVTTTQDAFGDAG